jgi:hypothetical protein
MAKQQKTGHGISTVYADLVIKPDHQELDEKAAASAASELSDFGLECNEFISRKLKTAEMAELQKLLAIVRHLDHPDIGDGLIEVVVERVLPLDLKVEYFYLMADLGYSVESSFLQHLQEAEELLHQFRSYMRSADEESTQRRLSLVDDLMSLPKTLKLSFLAEVGNQWGEQILPFLKQLSERDEDVASALVDIASGFSGEAAASILSRLVEKSTDKEAVKRAKKALYVLKEKGIVPKTSESVEPEAVIREDKDESDEAYSTTYDSFGARLLILAIPALSRILVCKASVDDTSGMLRFSAAEMSRKNYRDFIKELKDSVVKQGISSLVRIDPSHCRLWLQEAYELSKAAGHLIPEAFKSLRYRIKPHEADDSNDPTAELETPSEQDIRWIRNHADELFEIPEIAVWMVEKDQLLPYTNRYMEMAESKLVLNEEQRRAKLKDILADFASEYFNEERLNRLVTRLRETAYLLKRKGEKDQASKVNALAEDLSGLSPLSTHSFLESFMLRSIVGTIQAFASEEQRRSNQDDAIIKPR